MSDILYRKSRKLIRSWKEETLEKILQSPSWSQDNVIELRLLSRLESALDFMEKEYQATIERISPINLGS